MSEESRELFPLSQRVIYGKAPLFQVFCQLRFPTILHIEASAPAAFQERIQTQFPLFERAANPILASLPPEMLQAMGQRPGTVAYNFMTEDRSTSISLTPDSLTLSTSKYLRWESFFTTLKQASLALREAYAPAPLFFTRIGLKYADFIERSRLGLRTTKWSGLLRQELLGELSNPLFEDGLEDARRVLRIRLPAQNGSVLISHGLGVNQNTKEVGYVIDFDFFAEHCIEVSDVEPTLESYHSQAGRAFRWCITDLLHNALEPVPVDD